MTGRGGTDANRARLERNRAARFVGRAAELAAFERFRDAEPGTPPVVLHVSGPGGSGKSTLLQAMARRTDAERPALLLDGRDLPPSPEALVATVDGARDAAGIDGQRPHIVFIDHFEAIAPLERWFHETYLPDQSGAARWVLAARQAPALRWRVDPGWAGEILALSLAGFTEVEAREYLARRQVPEALHETAVHFALGSPLALALFADVALARDSTHLRAPDPHALWTELIGDLLRDVGDAPHRRALEACCVVRRLDLPLLERMIGADGAAGAFEWLRAQSFIADDERGVRPHDLVREGVLADLRRRDPAGLFRLGERAFDTLHDRIEAGEGDPLAHVQDSFFLIRDLDMQRESDPDAADDPGYTDHVRSGDWPAIDAMMRRFEGADALALLHRLHAAQPEALTVVRAGDGRVAGFFQPLAVDRLPADCIAADPTLQRFLRLGREELGYTGRVVANRFWLDREHGMAASRIYTHAFGYLAYRSAIDAPLLIGSQQPGSPEWREALARFGHRSLPDSETERPGGPALFAYQDMTAGPTAGIDWLRGAFRHAHGVRPGEAAAPAGDGALAAEDFRAAVRAALKHYGRLDRLRDNPLVDSRLVGSRVHGPADREARAQVLRTVIGEHCEALEQVATTRIHGRVLGRTYLRPARTQADAADALALSFGTYRRRLSEALRLLEAELRAAEEALGAARG